MRTTRSKGSFRRIVRMLSVGLVAATVSLVLAAPPASAKTLALGITARLIILGGPFNYTVIVRGKQYTNFGPGQELINLGYGVKLEGWGDDPLFDNREFGPFTLRGPDLLSQADGFTYELRRTVSLADLDEDIPDSDEIFMKVWLVDRTGAKVRNIESNTIKRQFSPF